MSAPLSASTHQAGEIQNITGEVRATFPDLADPSGRSFLRADFKSKSVSSLRFPGESSLDISSSSGGAGNSSFTTDDLRTIQFRLKDGITSGTYKFINGQGDKLLTATYAERAKTDNSYYLTPKTADEATLVLVVSDNGRRYTSNDFLITVKTSKGITLTIKVEFDIYLTIE